ncbi:unnamed protein product [Didymodactylos carnosus]|uniref:Uncharacterized protein n=1 Tax=Didymodactylos carnosus TaxID=1234261 RepID=A0A8S2CRA6_9BILA|nr:unnamed protein product [Didymodactylos carnosus]CAF3564919.1 unnamed protein product [Didymodactylos carnosus]
MGKSIPVSSSLLYKTIYYKRYLSNILDYMPTAVKTNLIEENTEGVLLVSTRNQENLKSFNLEPLAENIVLVDQLIVEKQEETSDISNTTIEVDALIIDNDEYFQQFDCPSDSDDSFSEYNYLDQYNLTSKQHDIIEQYELEADSCCRLKSKRSHKKMKAKRQIKTKHAKTIKINSHGQHLYVNHRLHKMHQLDPPSLNCMPSPQSSFSPLPSKINSFTAPSFRLCRVPKQSICSFTTTITNIVHNQDIPYQLHDYTIDATNIPQDIQDEQMVSFLLDMQNRELSPEDYEMLCRLDERVERKTVNSSVLDTLKTVYIENIDEYASFQSDISQILVERGQLRTELLAKEKVLNDYLQQRNTLTNTLKQVRNEKDDLLVKCQKLKQEKLSAESEKGANTIHVTILKEEKNILEQKLLESTQLQEEYRMKNDELSRQLFHSQQQLLKRRSISPSSHPLNSTATNEQLKEIKKRNMELEKLIESIHNNYKTELQVVRDESDVKDAQLNELNNLVNHYEKKVEEKEKNCKELGQRLNDLGKSCRSQMPDKLTLSEEDRRTIENDPDFSSVLFIYKSSKSLFDILVDYSLLQKQIETLTSAKEKIELHHRQNEKVLRQAHCDLTELKTQHERLKIIKERLQFDYEECIKGKQLILKEKNELDKRLHHVQKEFDDCLDDCNNMRSQIYYLFENNCIKGNLPSYDQRFLTDDVSERLGVVTFSTVEELYEQYMKSISEIRETDRLYSELEEKTRQTMNEMEEKNFELKSHLDKLKLKLDETKTDIRIETLAKELMEQQRQRATSATENIGSSLSTFICQTDLTLSDIKLMESTVKQFEQTTAEIQIERTRTNDQTIHLQRQIDHYQLQNDLDRQKLSELQTTCDEYQRSITSILNDVQTSETNCQELKSKNRELQHNYDLAMGNLNDLKREYDKLELDNQHMKNLQDEFLERLKSDIDTKLNERQENNINEKLNRSIEELNIIMKDCVKQTERCTNTSADTSSLTKMEIVYRQLQQRHQHDIEQHHSIAESLRLKLRDCQNELKRAQSEHDKICDSLETERSVYVTKVAELEEKLRSADTTTIVTRLLPSATLENRLKEEEEQTASLRSFNVKLNDKIDAIQKLMTSDKKLYEEKMNGILKELQDTRNDRDVLEKKIADLNDEQQRLVNEFKEKEDAFEMDIFKLKADIDNLKSTNETLKQTVSSRENDLDFLQQTVADYEKKLTDLEKEYHLLKEKSAQYVRQSGLPTSDLETKISDWDVHQEDFDSSQLTTADEYAFQTSDHLSPNDEVVQPKTPRKRFRLASTGEQTPTTTMQLRSKRSSSVDSQNLMRFDSSRDQDNDVDDNDDAQSVISTQSEPASTKKRKVEIPEYKLPAVQEEVIQGEEDVPKDGASQQIAYHTRSRLRKQTRLQPNQTT